ncbi:DUF2971 domain-containing protein [Jatrophihabitans lederbergiae]|uniref:DUF2971 domain-containing protein n=1 Tax=Jatrophihabitans lederbergiae TaxID=3075547 RepID=A0ABU2JJ89_9ACTN|nr:DUF2971 domain-containing protein [Jatrophihabitans sp. DSM 44399]MDT0264559.1 hypothetical protein [Jatrophihabitans sp. DSM 44399]
MADTDPSDADVLYHYTNTYGLLGIITNLTLWATDASYLNDAQEMRYGRAEVVEALNVEGQRLIDSEGPPGGGAEYSRGTVMRSAANTVRTDTPPDGQAPASVYVTCFCSDGDLLSQWRGYAEGSGFAVGFRRDYLEGLQWPNGRPGTGPDPTPGPELVKVRYGPTAVAALTQRVTAEIQPHPTGHPNATGWGRAQDFVWPALATIKHEAFREEQESRLILARPAAESPLRFRSGPLGVTPYVEIRFDAAAIAEVILGPGPDQPLRTRAVHQLLHHAGCTASVRGSTAPFRG